MRLLVILGLINVSVALFAAEERLYGLEKRIPWTSSKVIGSPEPPLPFRTEKAFANVEFKAPLYVAREPGTKFLLVVLQGGENDRPSKILRIADEGEGSEPELLLQMTNRLIYSVQFHPGYRTNGWIYVFHNGPTPQPERIDRISRFTVSREAPYRCDTGSERRIIEWRSAGHDGGDIVFGHDGMMYLSTGDGTSDSDGWNSGQTVDDLLGSVLRIDVDHVQGTNTYSIPSDNPFYGRTDARGEIWAYGLRNPWRMSIDEKTGQIWVGNNGQDLWETAHLVRRGENYGWSVYEGSYPFYLNRKRGPTPIVLPTIEHSHSEMRSLTGGVVYYGEEFPELNGTYIYGDYSTGQIWGARHDGTRLTWHRKLAQAQLQIAAFSLDHRGGLLIVDHGGAIHRLIRAPKEEALAKFPERLSETGIFASTRDHTVVPGIIPYSINAPGWMDGAEAERFIGLPGTMTIDFTGSEGWNFTNGAVLVQTLTLEMEQGNSASRRRIETRILTKQTGQWAGYTYRWKADQTDADLVPAKGEEISISRGGAEQGRAWRVPSRDECMACHSRAANFVLGLSEVQMNRERDYNGVRDHQLRALNHIGLFTKPLSKIPEEKSKLVDPYDEKADLEARARSYLHVNCSACHVEAGGGNSMMELGIRRELDRMRLVGARPQHDSFGIENAMLVAPGDPNHSVLIERLSRRGRGQMPPLVIKTVDERAVAMLKQWIAGMKPQFEFVKDWKLEDLQPALAEVTAGRSIDSGRDVFQKVGCAQCHRISENGGTVGPDLTGVVKRLTPQQLLESILVPSAVITEGFATTEIETSDDEIFTGFVEREDDQTVILRIPGSDRPMGIAKKQITRRTLSKLSNMPAGIVNSLNRDQILDLLAYLLSEGKAADGR